MVFGGWGFVDRVVGVLRTAMRGMLSALQRLFFVVTILVHPVVTSAGEEESRLAAFYEGRHLVPSEFFNPTLRGLDWAAIGEKYRPLVLAAETAEERSAVINRMLAELGASHTEHFTPDDVAYYDLFDIFGGSLRKERERLFPGGHVAYTGI